MKTHDSVLNFYGRKMPTIYEKSQLNTKKMGKDPRPPLGKSYGLDPS
jgi:hypothetical protein